ncbi:putative disease resistance protein RGA3 isoform X2 [Sorghum bicolor]|uniref:putative disease resistance protein RGA3 isoform X2 n=1 Tax=Sorghum bicolor TaxID=4558 RepID=UPI000B425FF5|nr:putative disease resistance protein RGA3 isoform X2 [Sorghum bicolor]|eukprot:XP_021302072.1 putative disease resistance protein RGA3 isoform X2 [Sorghum bicolor]
MALAVVGEALASVVLKEVSRKLGSAIGQQIKARWNLERDMEDIKNTLGIVQAVLRDAERRSVREEAVNLWLKMLKDAAYDISDMFDEFEDKLSKGKFSSSVAKLTMGKKLKSMREKLAKIAAQRTQFSFKLDACSTDQEEIKKRQTTSKINRATIVGRQKEKDDIVTLLKSDEEQETLVIPIFGFGGIGKTTLAKLVFNDDRMQDFDLRVWVYVSPHFDLEMIGKSIISQIKQPVEGLDDLQSVSNCLEEALGGRSCLIVLDDVWESNFFQLDKLRLMLSNFKEKSNIRIIVTTRTEEVASNIGTVTPYKLKALSDDHCWTLFKHMAFQSGFSCREDKNVLDKIGWDIAKKCQGVPMAAQALGFMLRNKSVEEWKKVRDSDIWDGSSTTDMLPSLKLSYYQMTDYLKLCFSYCSVFPKGCEIHRGDLIQQWISLGFIPSSLGEHLTLEKIGENYVNELLGMSFLQYSRPTSLVTKEDTNNSMLLSMHDLIHDLARSVLGDELFFVDGKKGYTSTNGNHRSLQMSLDSEISRKPMRNGQPQVSANT